MKRKLLFTERLLHGDGKLPFNLVIPLRIKGTFSAQNLYHALKKLQEKHPLLKARVKHNEDGRPWFVANDYSSGYVPVRMTGRVTEHDWKVEAVKEWAIPFDTSKGPLMRVVWLNGIQHSELILVIHHCICDGNSAISIVASMLQLLDDDAADIGMEEPISCIGDIVPSLILHDTRKIIRAKLAGGVASLVSWSIPVKRKVLVRKTDYMIHWKLDKESAAHLAGRCGLNSITMNTLLCTAILKAFKFARKEAFQNKISCQVDIRRFAPKIKRDHIFAFGLTIDTSLAKAPDFFSNAKKVQLDINKKTSKLDPYKTLMEMEAAHFYWSKLRLSTPYDKSPNDCRFTDLGEIDIPHQYRTFELETIFSPSAIGPSGNTTSLTVSTYRGQIDFTFIASEGIITYAEAITIKHKIMDILAKL